MYISLFKNDPIVYCWLALLVHIVLLSLKYWWYPIPLFAVLVDALGVTLLILSAVLLHRSAAMQRTDGRKMEIQLQSLINTTQDAVITIDRQGHILLFNPAAEHIFGYSSTEVHGKSVRILMPEPYASEHEDYIRHYEETREPRAIGRIRTVAARRKNGEVFPIELAVVEINIPGTTLYGAFIRDISEKVRLQELLVERERLAVIGTTAATFAHEVGNPLNSMLMTAQLLERYLVKSCNGEEKALNSLHSLTSEIKRLSLLLHEFRTLARRQNINLSLVSVHAIIADLLTVEGSLYQGNGIRIENRVPPELPQIEVDPEKLKQALLNLCKNAMDAMPAGGTLILNARTSGGIMYIDVSDTGVGVPPRVPIFDPFVTTKTQGTGLGLTIVRQIVAAHKGTLTYRSEPGEGTTFTLELPIRQRK